MPVDCKSDISVYAGPAGFAPEEKRPPDAGIDECLFKSIISLPEQGGAHTAHDIKWSRQSRLVLSRYAEIDLQPRCMKLAYQVLAKAYLNAVAVFRLQKATLKKSCAGTDLECIL